MQIEGNFFKIDGDLFGQIYLTVLHTKLVNPGVGHVPPIAHVCSGLLVANYDVEDPQNLQVLQEYARGGTCPTPGSPQRPERLVKPKKFQAKSKNVRFFRLRRFYYYN